MSQRAHGVRSTKKLAADFPLVHNFPMSIGTIHFAQCAHTRRDTQTQHTRPRERMNGMARIVIRIVRRFSRMWIMRMARTTSGSHQNRLQCVEWMAHTVETWPPPTHRRRRRTKLFSHSFYTPAPIVMLLYRLCGVCVSVDCRVRASHTEFVPMDVCVNFCRIQVAIELCVNEPNSRGTRNHQGWDVGAFR